MPYEVDKYTVSLLHFDDGIKDETGRVWTATGNAGISTEQSKFGKSSLFLNGTSQYLTTDNTPDFNFGTNDFTVDWWEYRKSATVGQTVFNSNVDAGIDYAAFKIGHGETSGDVINVWFSSGAKTMGPAILNQWTHYALVRSGNTFYAFQNGIIKNKWTSSLSIDVLDKKPSIGGNGQYFFSGYIDEFRVSKGIARWTEDFTPPSEPIEKFTSILRVTMFDSSEHEFQLETKEVESFVSWYNHHTSTDTTSYLLQKNIPGSKEYLAFDKIISFEVIDFMK